MLKKKILSENSEILKLLQEEITPHVSESFINKLTRHSFEYHP